MEAMKTAGKIYLPVLCIAVALMACGCGNAGDQGGKLDVTAMNAELAVRESAILKRLQGLSPNAVADALVSIDNAADNASRMFSELPQGDPSSNVAYAVTLSRFRRDVSSLVDEVAAAAENERAAVRDASRFREALSGIATRLGDERWKSFAGEFSGTLDETERLLDGWRKQRLEKMGKAEFATFPVFVNAATKCYDGWDAWIEEASAMQGEILEDLLPKTREISSNLAARVSDVFRERKRSEAATDKLRAIPLDNDLVESLRGAALAAWDGVTNETIAAMSALSSDEEAAMRRLRDVIKEFERQTDALDNRVSGFEKGHGQYLPEQSSRNVRQAIARAREVKAQAVATVQALENSIAELQMYGEVRADAIASAIRASEAIRSMPQVDEMALAQYIGEIEAMRIDLEALDAPRRRKNFSSACGDEVEVVNAALEALTKAAGDFAKAKDEALVDEKTAKWKAEKKQMHDALNGIKKILAKTPPPGHSRPENDVKSLQGKVARLWARVDSLEMDSKENVELWDDIDDARTDAENIESRTRWTVGTRHPTEPHVSASREDGRDVWGCGPGYVWEEPGSYNLNCHWSPGRAHPSHPHVSSGQKEGTWIPDPGYKARWDGDLDPVWTVGTRHPTLPHIFASRENGKDVWDCDPGYVWEEPGSHNLNCHWSPGRRHPTYPGIFAAQEEGIWNTLPGWAFVNPGTTDLRARWVPGSRYPGKPHVFASPKENTWDVDPGYRFVNLEQGGDLSVRWEPGIGHPTRKGLESAPQEGFWYTQEGWSFVTAGASQRTEKEDLRTKWQPGTRKNGCRHVYASDTENKWTPDPGYSWIRPGDNDDFSVKWTPGWISPDGTRRAKQQEGCFETKRDCTSCENGYRIKWRKCGVCDGSGRFLFGECRNCDGIGKVKDKSFCTSCDGVGWRWR